MSAGHVSAAGHAAMVIGGMTVTPAAITAVGGAVLGLSAICLLARALSHMARLARAQSQVPAPAPAKSGGGKGRLLALGGLAGGGYWLYEKAARPAAQAASQAQHAAPAPPAVPVTRPPVTHTVTQVAHSLMSGTQIVTVVIVVAVAVVVLGSARHLSGIFGGKGK